MIMFYMMHFYFVLIDTFVARRVFNTMGNFMEDFEIGVKFCLIKRFLQGVGNGVAVSAGPDVLRPVHLTS